jgi:hypothetical protein
LLGLLESSEADKFVAHLYQARKRYRLVCERPKKGNQAIERDVISSYQIAQSLAFNGDHCACLGALAADSRVRWADGRGKAACAGTTGQMAGAQLEFAEIPRLLKFPAGVPITLMRTLIIIFGTVVVLALAGFAATGGYRNAAICDTADCLASECP